MAFLSRSNLKWLALSPYHLFLLAILSTSFGGMEVVDAYASSSDVQTYTQQAIPDDQATDDRYNSPLQAGQMTLEDVLAAHPAPKKLVPAPITQVQSAPLSPPRATGEPTLSAKSPNSSANVMLMQGMKSALDQASSEPSSLTPPQLPNQNQITAPMAVIQQIAKPTAADIIESAPSPSLAVVPQIPDQSQTSTELLQSPVTTLSVAPVPVQTVSPREATQEPEVITPMNAAAPVAVAPSVAYQPGQAPQNLGRQVLLPSRQVIPTSTQPPKTALPNNNSVPLDVLSTEQIPTPPPTAAEIVTQSSPEETMSVSQRPLPPTANPNYALPPISESSAAAAPVLSSPTVMPAPTAAEIVAQQPIDIARESQRLVATTQPVVGQPIPVPTVETAPVLASPPAVAATPTVTESVAPSSTEETLSVSQKPLPLMRGPNYAAAPAPAVVATTPASPIAAPAPTAAEIAIQQPIATQSSSNINPGAPVAQPIETPQTQPQKTAKPSDAANCVPHVASWTKTCSEAGYPENYTGQIRGETRIVCPTNSLQDVWVANSCSPPAAGPTSTPLTVPTTQAQAASASTPAAAGVGPTTGQTSPASQKSEVISNTGNPMSAPMVAPTGQMPIQTSSPFDGVCGSANAVATTITPIKGLCSSGQPSRISGKGPWTWTCTSLKGGATASCSADKIQESQCGPATFVKTRDAPEDGLCNLGEATTVTGNGPWHWTCRNADNTSTVSCEAAVVQDGKCGSADDVDSRKRPMDNLCSTGTSSPVIGNDSTWTWVCAGINGGDSDNCSAKKIIDTSDASTAPIPETAVTPIATSNPPAARQIAPAAPDVLATSVQPAAVKLCGTASELMAIQAPDKNLCAIGMASSVTGDGPWTWTCGDRDGHSAKCSTLSPLGSLNEAPPMSDGKAQSANDIISEAPAPIANPAIPVTSSVSKPVNLKQNLNDASQPECGASAGSTSNAAPVEDFCTTGVPSALRGSGPWAWDCTTKHGGSVTCSAYKAVEAMCGGSDGTTQKQAPTKDLCAVGNPTKIKGTGPWTWSCANDQGNVTVKCSVAKVRVRAEQIAPAEQVTPAAEATATPAATPNTQQETDSIIKAPKPFEPAPQPSSTPPTPTTSDLKPPTEAASLPTDAQPVQPPAPQPGSAAQATQAPGASEAATTTSASSGFNLDADISTISFGHGSENINSDAQPLVDKLVSVLQANSNVRITLTAYADSAGLTAREARRLSLTRALAIRDYLSSKGIANSRIDVRALGAAPSGSQDRVDIKAD